MYLAKNSHTKFEEFYREFFDERKTGVPKIKIYSRRGAGLITRLFNINGITIGRHHFYSSAIDDALG